jgi:hypothetical protein
MDKSATASDKNVSSVILGRSPVVEDTKLFSSK